MYNTSVPSSEKGWKAGVCEWIIIVQYDTAFQSWGGWMCSVRSLLLISSGHSPPWLPSFLLHPVLPAICPSIHEQSTSLGVIIVTNTARVFRFQNGAHYFSSSTSCQNYPPHLLHVLLCPFFLPDFLLLLTLLVSTYGPPHLCMFFFPFL